MPNDNQPAKSYIETVMARADVATKELVLDPSCQRRDWENGIVGNNGGLLEILNAKWGTSRNVLSMNCDDAEFFFHARQDIPTLGKMLLRAIGALEEYDDASEFPSNRAAKALADINALAAKGSQ